MLDRITSPEGTLLALVARSGDTPPGVNFISDPGYPLQVAVNVYASGDAVRAHRHPDRDLHISTIQEVLHIDSGRVIADIMDHSGALVQSVPLSGGDTIFFIAGGHGLRILEKTKIIEVKQGPYRGISADKVYLDPPVKGKDAGVRG
ncbi:MAG: Conserved hypothetical cytosolic protein [Methanomicrobia archaeon]|jgi:hypothetical protein|nr:Conserved hypothetical cytosolic protein [Methanomicrobia archaeon]MDD1638935.1 hypothetical protein [Methanomicrobiales archaeon]MDD1644934.1 hypothetical protein [Methanomicrobiales archaeon]MDD1647475.1 hypothetical protein [Methanomicrobiales archaeon]